MVKMKDCVEESARGICSRYYSSIEITTRWQSPCEEGSLNVRVSLLN
jgi:hypothetical protein